MRTSASLVNEVHFAAHDCTQPHTGLTGKITRAAHFRRSRGLTCDFEEWGGWDSNPGPADYESSLPATCPIGCDLGGRELTRSWLAPFGHVFGMIMLDARPDSAAQAWRGSDSALLLTPVPDRVVHSRNVVAQGNPDLFVVDAVVGVRGDDPHALDLPPGDLRRRLDDLIRQFGGNVAQSADDSLARQAQRAFGVPALLPKAHQFGCRIGRLS